MLQTIYKQIRKKLPNKKSLVKVFQFTTIKKERKRERKQRN